MGILTEEADGAARPLRDDKAHIILISHKSQCEIVILRTCNYFVNEEPPVELLRVEVEL
jgi:hypothetical protein